MANYFRMDGWVKTAQGPAVPGAQIYVCLQPANDTALPPTPLANIYSDVNGLVPITQPILTDGFGHYDFYALANVYTIVVGLGGIVQQVYVDQSLGGASGSSGGGGGTALVLQTNGTLNGDQLQLNLAGAQSASVSDNGSGTVTITGAVFQTDGVSNVLQNKFNLISGSGVSLSSDSLGGVTISATGSVGVGQNVINGLSWGDTTVFPQNGTYQGTLNTLGGTVFFQISSGMLLVQPSTWKVTISTVSTSTVVTMVIIKCARGTGTVLSSQAVKFGGSSTPTLTPAGNYQSDAINFPLVAGFDYYFALNTSTNLIGYVAPGTNQQVCGGGGYITASNALPIGGTLPSWGSGSTTASNSIIFDLVSA